MIHLILYIKYLQTSARLKVEVLPVFVDEGVEGHPVSPAGGEVVDVDVGIPEEQTHLGLIMTSSQVSHCINTTSVTT